MDIKLINMYMASRDKKGDLALSFELAVECNLPRKFKQTLERLQAGNSRFMIGMRVGDITPTRREELLKAQHPTTTVLTCSDSRVVPAFIFDQGLGDLFVVRTAGNIVDTITIGSLEYSCEHLNTPVLLVMGHSRCDAISGACKGDAVSGYMKDVLNVLQPGVEACRSFSNGNMEKLIRLVIVKNVRMVVDRLSNQSETLKKLVTQGELLILGAIYQMETGKVEFLLK